jgi:hypothetical protein
MEWLFSSALWLLAIILVSVIVILGLVKLIFNKLEGEKLTTYLDFTKWIVVSVALVIIANVIDASFKDREAGINEIQQYDKYVSLVTQEDKLADKRRLAQYFAIVTASEKLRSRWKVYLDTLDVEYLNTLIQAKKLNDSLAKLLTDTTQKSQPEIKQKIMTIQEHLDNITYQITPGTTDKRNDLSEAARYERIGFEALLQRNADNAIAAFNNSEERYHGYHSVYDLANYLISHRQGLVDVNNDPLWKQAYKDILKKFPWGMPGDVKEKMEGLSK